MWSYYHQREDWKSFLTYMGNAGADEQVIVEAFGYSGGCRLYLEWKKNGKINFQ